MKKRAAVALMASLFALGSSVAHAGDTTPGATSRSNTQNFKDMVLAMCVATAYKNAGDSAKDAASSASALRDWTEYDLDAAPDAINALINRYLSRDYHNPLADAEIEGVRFDLLKCFDLYHSSELSALARRLVMPPQH